MALPTVAPVPLAFPVTVTVLVAVNWFATSYVAVVVLGQVPPLHANDTVYLLAVAFAVNSVALLILTVVLAVVVLAGVFPEPTVQLLNVYPVLAVAPIFALCVLKYVAAPVTVLIPVPLFNVNT